MNSYWWYRPSRIALVLMMPIAFFAYTASNRFYQQFGAFNAITGEDFFLAWLSIASFAAASWFGEVLNTGPRKQYAFLRGDNYRPLLFVLVAVATAAALVLLLPVLTDPQLISRILQGDTGAAYLARDKVDKIPGVTSQQNLFSLIVVLLMLRQHLTGRRRTKGENLVLGFVIGLAAVKAVLHSERLALIELLLPLGILAGGMRRRSIVWGIAPILGVVALFFFFMITESLRSWAFYADNMDSLFEFALARLIGYYITAVNNGAFVYNGGHSYFFPVLSAGWLWRFPIPGLDTYWASITGATVDPETLLAGLNVEFDNISGIFAPLIDFGPVGGVIVWIILGYMSGRLFRRFVEGDVLGLILFPTWYVGVLEVSRVLYWGDSRYLPPLVISLLVTLIFKPRGTTSGRRQATSNRMYQRTLQTSAKTGLPG